MQRMPKYTIICSSFPKYRRVISLSFQIIIKQNLEEGFSALHCQIRILSILKNRFFKFMVICHRRTVSDEAETFIESIKSKRGLSIRQQIFPEGEIPLINQADRLMSTGYPSVNRVSQSCTLLLILLLQSRASVF